MRLLYSFVIGSVLGLGSVLVHSSLPPVGLALVLISTVAGIWAIGRMWGGRAYRTVAALAWMFVIVRAGFPGMGQEFLIEGSPIGISFLNLGVLCLVLAVLLPA